MEGGEGMVAVVRGLRDSGLAVTLLDGSREYTLMPNAMLHSSPSPTKDVASLRASKQQSTQHNSMSTDAGKDSHNYSRNTGAQVTDGRYASIYKMAHCHVKPSSPPLELTEFPPQRAALCPGHGNFEVGGAGSGETYIPVKAHGKFRGGMSWPDRGAVCSPRSSHETDAFANSLRKYPCVSPDRSTEIVERLINYTQSRASKTYSIKNQTSPQRIPDSTSSQNLKCSRASTPKTPQRYDPIRDRSRVDESPTRDRSKKAEGDAPEMRKAYYRNYDVKYFRDSPKRVKDNVRILSTYPYNQPVCPPIKQSYDNMPPRPRRFTEQFSNNSVNTEIQAAVKMVSREVGTVARPEPMRRTVAVPFSHATNADGTEGDNNLMDNTKSTQKSFTLKRKSVQTVSFTDITSSDNDFNVENSRKSKSQEELRMTDDYFRRKVLAVFKNVSGDDRTKQKLKDECLRRLWNGRAVERAHATYNRCIDTMAIAFPQNCIEFDEELIENGRVHNIGIYDNITQVYHAEVTPFNVNEDIDFAIKHWIDDLPINTKDFNSDVDKRHILNNMACKLKQLIVIRFRNEITNLKTEILEMIEEVPIDTNVSCNRDTCLSKLVDTLLERIRTTFVCPNNNHENRNTRVKTPVKQTPQAKECLKEFVREHLWEYLRKANIIIPDTQIRDIENELTDILANAIDSENYRDVKHQMKYILTEIGNLTDDQSKYFINVLLDKFKKITMANSYSQIFTVLQNTTSLNNTDFTIEGITEGDLNANLDFYMKQLCIQIDDWLAKLNVNQMQDRGFRQVVVHDLAGDIIDRHKYLELNPASKGTDEEEIEQLKYQIFKWINKLVGEDNTETIQHAEELMSKIRTIPVPMLRAPHNTQKDVSSNTCPSPQCQTSYSNKCKPNQTADTSNIGRRISSPGEMTTTPHMSQGSMDPSMNRSTTSSGAVPSLTDSNVMNPSVGDSRIETKNGFTQNSTTPVFDRGPQGLKAEVKSTLKRMNSPMPPTPQINRNIRDNRMNFPSGTNGAITRGTNDSLPALGAYPGMNDTGRKVFADKRLSGPAAIASDPAKLYSSNINQQTPLPQSSYVASPQVANTTMKDVSRPNSSRGNTSGPQPTCCPKKDPTALSIKRLNEEFDEYLRNWVQEIPIVVSKPEEQAVAEKARLGLYNGIWKAITKCKFEPAIFNNRFYYQDVLDDEIEDLLNILPKTPELERKKHALKVKLIEKTTDTTEQILNLTVTASYRQQLLENVENSLPTLDKTNENIAKWHEELQKLCLAEDYILYIRYKDEDQVRANVYRKKLLKNIETIIDNIKKHHGQELKDIDPSLYMNEIVSALNKVPIPSENTIREEADEILLGIEIEQWYSDLPLIKNDDNTVELQRRRLRDALEKKIHDLEKESNLTDSVASKELRQHIAKFLEKVALQEGTDINFLTDELVNRLKNRPRDGVRRKSVAFQEPQDYQDFQNNMQLCSTMRTSQIDPDSIRRRSIGFQEPQDYQEFSRNMPCCSSVTGQPIKDGPKSWPSFQTPPDEEWRSSEGNRLPPSMPQNGRQTSRSLDQVSPVPAASYPSPKATPQSYMPEANAYGGTCCGQPTCPNSSKQIQNSSQGFAPSVPQNQSQNMANMPSTSCVQPSCPNSIKFYQESNQGFSQSGLSNEPQTMREMARCGLRPLSSSQAAGSMHSKTASTLPCHSKYIQGGNYKTDRGAHEIHSSSSQQQQNNSRMYPPIGQPIGYSAPKQFYKQMLPEGRKYNQMQIPVDGVRRNEMEDTESEVERETCRCMERCRRRRRRPMMVTCGEYDMKCPQLIPIRCPYAYFFQ